MTPVIGIDPGTRQSAYLVWDRQAKEVLEKGTLENAAFIERLAKYPYLYPIGLEMVQNFGSPMSNEVIETIVFTGRIIQLWHSKGARLHRMFRSHVKTQICRDSKAKDSWVRQALIDGWGPIGKKDSPGPLYGVVEHEWQALAAAVVATEFFYPTQT